MNTSVALVAAIAGALVVASGAAAGVRRGIRVLLLAAIAWAIVAGLLVTMLKSVPAGALAVWFVVLVAWTALGRACARALPDALDAIALSSGLALIVVSGVFVLGPLAVGLPAQAIDVALAANPVTAVLSTAGVDVLRSEPFYELSPIAHLQFAYPEISGAMAAQIALPALAVGFISLSSRLTRPTSTR